MSKDSSGEVTPIIVGHANTFHDPAIAVVSKDAVYAEALERHMQCKRALGSAGFFYSNRIIQAALTRLGILPVENASVTYRSAWAEQGLAEFTRNTLENPKENRTAFELIDEVAKSALRQRQVHERQLDWILRGEKSQMLGVPSASYPKTPASSKEFSWETKLTEHRFSHIGMAVYTSPFDECIVMVSDAMTEGSPLTFLHYANNEFKTLSSNEPMASVSLAQLYFRMTMLCGFDPMEGEEWKVMGLAAYGKPDPRIREIFDRTFTVKDLVIVPTGEKRNFERDLEEVLGRFRLPGDNPLDAADLAHNFQAFFTDIVIRVLRNAFELGLSKNLVMGGGCALNSSANGQIVGKTGFERLHVPCAPGDDGNALGAALYEKHYVRKAPRKAQVMSPYLGSWIDLHNLERVVAFGGIDHWRAPDEEALCTRVAKILADGKIIGWVQGRAEFGPRALGNRSILADPRLPTMKDEINRRVKFREEYRPLAPSILHEHGPEYFENYQESPYMERTLAFRQEVRERVPAVVHVDGTGRLQTVKKEWNPVYHRLISSFHDLTGIPLLLNTSFNVMGKPIVHSVSDALAVFYTTDLDYLVIENYVLSKRPGGSTGNGE